VRNVFDMVMITTHRIPESGNFEAVSGVMSACKRLRPTQNLICMAQITVCTDPSWTVSEAALLPVT
jgi:hypothetical protein